MPSHIVPPAVSNKSKEDTISKESSRENTPSSPAPSKSHQVHPSGSIRSIMNFSSPPSVKESERESKEQSKEQRQGADDKAAKTNANANTNIVPVIRITTEPEQEPQPMTGTNQSLNKLSPSLSQILSQTFNLQEFSTWPYSETLLNSLITLKTEQERTKREYQRSETLQRSLEIIDHSARSGVPGWLIPQIFQTKPPTAQQQQQQQGVTADGGSGVRVNNSAGGPSTSVFKVNLHQNQPVNYQFHHWQNPDSETEGQYGQGDITDSNKKRKNSFSESSNNSHVRKQPKQGHRRNQSDIPQMRRTSFSESARPSAPMALQHSNQNSPYSYSSQNPGSSPYKTSSRQTFQYPPPQQPQLSKTSAAANTVPPQYQHHQILGSPARSYQYPPPPPPPPPQIPLPQHRSHSRSHSQSQISPNRYYETPPMSSSYQFPNRNVTGRNPSILPPASIHQYPVAPPGPTPAPVPGPMMRHSRSDSFGLGQLPQPSNQIMHQPAPAPPLSQHHSPDHPNTDHQNATGQAGSGSGSGAAGSSNTSVSFLISTPSNPPK
ncbi:hypothetical protein WICPIJ_000751 [Wickerhamomyces pijperi]|uniref:Uncharacterized protein n=1 Tax=Wickerhamomyces pijperi TaxID=599730 RepID=A0A9P8TRJ0_WICPI|nr:hypothetical protein WICPIJ_000751 [Wickerhamomyces pijperi]